MQSVATQQQAWDDRVYGAMTQEECDRGQAAAMVAQQPGLTFEQALAELRSGGRLQDDSTTSETDIWAAS